MRKVIVSPSILSADFTHLQEELNLMESVGAEWIHFDVMDGHFVDNISFGIPVLKSIACAHHMLNDVHIMISEPFRYYKRFIEAGAQLLTFHYEAVKEDRISELISLIKKENCKVGISLKPKTDIEVLTPYLKQIDLVLIMSVEPGFGGQSFIYDSLNKIRTLRQKIDENKLDVLIEVDGGINENTGPECLKAGADVLVAGSYLFNHDDTLSRIKKLKGVQ